MLCLDRGKEQKRNNTLHILGNARTPTETLEVIDI